MKVVHADPGRRTLQVEIDPGAADELALDNVRFGVVNVEESVRVLIVNGGFDVRAVLSADSHQHVMDGVLRVIGQLHR